MSGRLQNLRHPFSGFRRRDILVTVASQKQLPDLLALTQVAPARQLSTTACTSAWPPRRRQTAIFQQNGPENTHYLNTQPHPSLCGVSLYRLTLSNSVERETGMLFNIGRDRSVSNPDRLLCGLDAAPLEDLPMVPVDVIHFHDGLARSGCEQRLARPVIHRPPGVAAGHVEAGHADT